MFKPRKPQAFTLIELLVVISIIGLLMSILVPSLRKAREAARTTLCGSNLHGAGVALNVYANDFGSRIPPIRQRPEYYNFAHPFISSGASGYQYDRKVAWQDLLLWYMGAFKEQDYYEWYVESEEDSTLRKALTCPKWNAQTKKYGNVYGGPYSFGYGANSNIPNHSERNVYLDPAASKFGGDGMWHAAPRLTSIKDTGSRIYCGDSYHWFLSIYGINLAISDEWQKTLDDNEFRKAQFTSNAPWYTAGLRDLTVTTCDPYRHGSGSNYMFLDGHVKKISAEDAYSMITRKMK